MQFANGAGMYTVTQSGKLEGVMGEIVCHRI